MHSSCLFRTGCKYKNLFGKGQKNWDWINKIDMAIILTWLIMPTNIINTVSVMNYKHSITGKLARLASWAYLECVALIKWKGISK